MWIETIRIYHICEGRIVMTNSDPMGWIFLSYPHTNNGFFFLLTTVFNKLPEIPEYAKMQFHMMPSL